MDEQQWIKHGWEDKAAYELWILIDPILFPEIQEDGKKKPIPKVVLDSAHRFAAEMLDNGHTHTDFLKVLGLFHNHLGNNNPKHRPSDKFKKLLNASHVHYQYYALEREQAIIGRERIDVLLNNNPISESEIYRLLSLFEEMFPDIAFKRKSTVKK